MKKIFGILICMLIIGTCFVVNLDIVSAEDLVEGDYTYTVSYGEATLTGYAGAGGAITIPPTLGGYPTVAIGGFNNIYSITSIIIPDSVRTIVSDAFSGCSSLTSVTFGNSVTNIESHAFQSCSALTSVIIPNSVTTIGGSNVFSHCSSLTSVTIGSGVETIAPYTFNACATLTTITFLGLVAPTTVGTNWIMSTPEGIKGHAYAASNFPAPGEKWNGLTMGEFIIEVNEPPVAGFTWAPSAPKANQSITFDASTSSDTDGSISKYEWDWNNDGTYDESKVTPTVTHSWTQASIYPVKLQVTDNDGATNTKTMTVTVSSGDQTPGTTEPKTPGFELILLLCAIGVSILLLKKKRKV